MTERTVTDLDAILAYDEGAKAEREKIAAWLRTGKLHGPMTQAQQIDAVRYAHRIPSAIIERRAK